MDIGDVVEVRHPAFEIAQHKKRTGEWKRTGEYMRGLVKHKMESLSMILIESLYDGKQYQVPKKYCHIVSTRCKNL